MKKRRTARRMVRRNVDGFLDGAGNFHPIRGSEDYSAKRAGEVRKKKKKSRSKKKPRRRNPLMDALLQAAATEAGSEGVQALLKRKKKNPARKQRSRRKGVRRALAHLVGSIAHRRPAKKKNPRRPTHRRATRPNSFSRLRGRTRYYVVNLKSRRNPEPVVEVGSVAEGCKQIKALKSHFGQNQKLAIGKVVPEGK